MAYMVRSLCAKCGTEFMHASGKFSPLEPKICHVCEQIIEKEKRDKHFVELNFLTLEERVRRIEEWIYDHKPPIDIHNLKF